MKKSIESVMQQLENQGGLPPENEESNNDYNGQNLKKFILRKLRKHPHLEEITILLSSVEDDDLILTVMAVMLEGLRINYISELRLEKKFDAFIESINFFKEQHEADKLMIAELKQEKRVLERKVIKLTSALNEEKRAKDKKRFSRFW